MRSFVVLRTSYSRLAANSLVAEGKSVWRSCSTLTGYALHASPRQLRELRRELSIRTSHHAARFQHAHFLASWTACFSTAGHLF